MAAHELARLLSSLYSSSAQTFPGRGTPRVDALADLLHEADRLLGIARSCLPHLKLWLPKLQMQAHNHYQLSFERSLAEAKQGGKPWDAMHPPHVDWSGCWQATLVAN